MCSLRKSLFYLASAIGLILLVALAPHAQAQSSGPLVSWRDDVSEPAYKPNPADPGGDGIFLGMQVVATPVSSAPVGAFKAIAAGRYHAVAIRADGTLVSWGDDTSSVTSNTPKTSTFKAIAAGDYHSVAVRNDGTLVSWGDDTNGQVGNTPATGTYLAVAAGEFHSVALRSDGTLVAWGLDEDGQVSRTPTTGTYTAVASGASFCVALRSDGTLVAWGNDNDRIVSTTPSGKFKAIAAGSHHALAIRTDGTLAAWGNDVVLGDDGEPTAATIVSNTPNTGTYIGIAAGDYHSVALRSDGTLISWGDDTNGQVSAMPAGAFQAIAAAGSYSLGIKGYSWSGFLPPINADGSSVFKLGSTIPVKFALTGPSAGIATLTAKLSYTRVGDASSTVNEPVSTGAGDSGNTFRYDPTSGQYIFNWSTKGLSAGTYQLQINLGDGLTHTVNIDLR